MPKHTTNGWAMMSQRQRMSPFPNYMSMESVCNEMKKFVGANLRNVLVFFQGNMMYVFQASKDHHRAGALIANKVKNNPKLYSKLVKLEDGHGEKLVDFTKQAGKKVGSKVTNKQLYQMFANYEKLYKQVYAVYGSVWTMEENLMEILYDIVSKRIKDGAQITDIINILTKQPSAMVATIERQNLLVLAVKILANNEWTKVVLNGKVEDIKNIKALDKLISAHQNNFFWITRDYEDPILTYEAIVEKLKVSIAGEAKKELIDLDNKLKDSLSERKRWEKELKLNKKELALFSAMRDAAHLKEQRKKFVSQSLYYFDPVLSEIGKRLYMSIKQVRFLRTRDAFDALVKGKDLSVEINNRFKLSVWNCKGKNTQVVTGTKAEELFKEFCQVDKNATEFSGMPVSPGVARGPAKIVLNPNECDKVNKGDIIVSVQVVPSFSTAIIKSAGIVCDGGHGITSHPATLSREAGIPCVIQTRFVREVVKDGDILEVDGYKGIVKIIK
jgi:phosphohistidine swiveling domain-containing protein